MDVNGKIAVIGGGLVGGETANFLATHGNAVTIIEGLEEILKEEPGNIKKFMLESYEDHKVEVLTEAMVEKIAEDGTVYVKKDGECRSVGTFDAVVTAVGMKPVHKLKKALEQEDVTLICVGDAKKAGNALSAIEDGYVTALDI